MKTCLLLIFSVIALGSSAQVAEGPIYFNGTVTKQDSLQIDTVWRTFKKALIAKDAPTVKAMSTTTFSLSLIKPGHPLAFPIKLSQNTAVDSLFKIVQHEFFQTIDKSYMTLSALAAAEPKKSLESYESLDPVIFGIMFTQYPVGTTTNKGWSFAFLRSAGVIKFFGLTQL
jgi:hypothetical protein